jgi:Protein of unknown function (DUF1203)
MKDFQISGLPIETFQPLFNLSESELAARNARRCIVDSKPGFPCRVSLVDAEIGESVILLHYAHHQVNGPYLSSGPIYVRESAVQAELKVNEIPQVARQRLMSVRGFDSNGFMLVSDVVEGQNLQEKIADLFASEKVAYLHLHNAKPGCYSCRVDRARNKEYQY